MEVEQLPENVITALREGDLGDGPVRNKDAKEVGNKFGELGMDKDLMRKIYAINATTVLVNDTNSESSRNEGAYH